MKPAVYEPPVENDGRKCFVFYFPQIKNAEGGCAQVAVPVMGDPPGADTLAQEIATEGIGDLRKIKPPAEAPDGTEYEYTELRPYLWVGLVAAT